MTVKNLNEILDGTYQGKCIQAFGITHYKYQDCPPEELVEVPDTLKTPDANPQVFVHTDCLEAFKKMVSDAKNNNITLRIASGYRSAKYQIEVFKRKLDDPTNPSDNSFAERLKYSAPSGFSEHHTGLAIDINSTENDFANTKEYQWLNENAKFFNFEISFPQNNLQGLGFEPWHWRFIGTQNAKETFLPAQNNIEQI